MEEKKIEEYATLPLTEAKPWLKYYSESDKQAELPSCSMYEYLGQTAAAKPKNNAVNFLGKKYAFPKLFELIDEAANAFVAWGVKKGEIVSFVSVAIPQTIAAIYALNKIGAIANLIDPRMDVAFISKMVQKAGSRYLICNDATFAKSSKAMADAGVKMLFVQKVGDGMPFIKRVLVNSKLKKSVTYSSTVVSWADFLKKSSEAKAETLKNAGEEIAAIAYTGGTTGFPKGVMFTNTSINAVAFNFIHNNFEHENGHSFLGIIPVFTSYGIACGTHMPLVMGLTLIPVPQFKPAEFGKLVKKYKPNHMVSTPAFYETLMNSREVRNMDLSFLITLGSGGDTMNEGLEERFSRFMAEHNIKYPLAQGYGLSEMSSAVTFCAGNVYKSGSVGIPSITTTVGIFDSESGKELGAGQVGEVCATGPNMMKGYFGEPEETAHIMREHEDGKLWIHSGDLGYLDEDGFLFIVGRLKRMITRFDGHKVFPVNIESLVAARDDVQNCCVVGVKDREHSQGDYPLVVVTLYGDDAEDEGKCRDIYATCQAELEERGRPVAVIPVKEIPLTPMGKNDYRTLGEQFGSFDYLEWAKNNPTA